MGGQVKKYVCSDSHINIKSWWLLYTVNLLCSNINRCQESTSSPGVSNSISEGIIEEEEDEEAEEESNKKRMKEDDQEVLFVSLLFQHLWFWELDKKAESVDFSSTVKKGKLLHLASWAVQDRKILGGLVQRSFLAFSHLPGTKTAPTCRWVIWQRKHKDQDRHDFPVVSD